MYNETFINGIFEFTVTHKGENILTIRVPGREFSRVLADGGRCVLIVNSALTQIKRTFTPAMIRRGLRHNLRQLRDVARGYRYALLSQRMFRTDKNRPTGSGMYVTTRFLRRCMKEAGMTMTTCDHAHSIYIGTRTSRP